MQNISKDDVKMINDSFSVKKPVETISANAKGKIIKPKKQIVNVKGYAIESFWGRTLKHNKSVIPCGERQLLIGKKGQKFEDIPEELRKKVVWSESDFI